MTDADDYRIVASALTPHNISTRSIKNRIVVTAHTYGFVDGSASGQEAMIDYVGARLSGGVGMLIMGETAVGPTQAAQGPMWGAAESDDGIVAMYSRISELARAVNATVFEQLYHPGGQVWHEELVPAIAPSAIPHSRSYVVPMSMTTNQIANAVDDYVAAARRAHRGGLHGVEIKCDQGKLVHQFLSGKYNFREDEFGGIDVLLRSRFLEDLLTRIRVEMPTLLLGVRLPIITADHDAPEPQDLGTAEVQRLAVRLEELGLIDYVSFSFATNSSALGYLVGHPDERTKTSRYYAAVRVIRASLKLPVIVAGGIRAVADASALVDAGTADFVGMTRAHIADPDLVNKVVANKQDSIIPCIGCNIACVGNTWYGHPVRCTMNPKTGRESIQITTRSLKGRKRLAIIGGGPAGLQAALAAGHRGIDTTIFERTASVGGGLLLASELPGRSRFKEGVEFFKAAIARESHIDLRLMSPATDIPDLLASFSAVIVAVGSVPAVPQQFRHSPICITDIEVLRTSVPWTGRSVIVVDSERRRDALGIAEHLSREGATVEVVTPFDAVGLGLDPVTLVSRLGQLSRLGVNLRTWTEVSRVDGNTVQTYNQITGEYSARDDVSSVIFVCNGHPVHVSSTASVKESLTVVTVGDAVWPRGLEAATAEGHDVGSKILEQK
ncbi:oxidoreductase [Subtercola lobariae]|uniref:N-methylproline demethylase n=1 Tax=Subtercola lobariae TaxID=1588641 RepID=A0A917B3W8_9MICO|nr:FAD-dependent oxidoreductase [Subtercola lobariae]GGF18489.1 N-methylproline demethylase [Subtercola lobariae]